jgi:hypothetical protein
VAAIAVYDLPLKRALSRYLRSLRYRPSQLEPVVSRAIQLAKTSEDGTGFDTMHEGQPELRFVYLLSKSKTYVDGVLGQSTKFEAAREHIHSYQALGVVGAGVSFERHVPLASALEDLLSFVQVESFEKLKESPVACEKFKKEFRDVCGRKRPGVSHKLIARCFPSRLIEIVCLNWDDLIERAHPAKFPREKVISVDKPVSGTNFLWKFHGDVGLITSNNDVQNGGWTFPRDPGRVFDSFEEYLRRSTRLSSMFTILIIGYSEQDAVIVDKIIKRLGDSPPRPIYRIGLSIERIHDPRYLVGPADFVLTQVLA